MKTKFTFLFILVNFFIAGYSQQPVNGGFNTFTQPLNPDGWFSFENLFGLANNVFTFQDSVDKVEGHSSLKLVSDSVPNHPSNGVMPGFVSLGAATPGPNGIWFQGDTFTERPDTLIFDYKHSSPNGPDTGMIYIRLTSNTVTVLEYSSNLADQSSWTHVELPLTSHYANGLTPDTLLLQIQSGGAMGGANVKGTNMHLDNLRFAYGQHNSCVAPTVYTMGHDPLGSHNFNLYGALNTNDSSSTYSFTYSTDSLFTSPVTTPGQIKTNNSLQVVWASVIGLAANTTYYYHINAVNPAGCSAVGKVFKFFSDTTSYDFENLGADIYGTSYAEFNGKVAGLTGTNNISFEYGLTPDMGLTTTSNQAVVSDGNSYTFRGVPSGLATNALYFFRVKIVNGSDTTYSDIKACDLSNPYSFIHALPATNITATSADLNGQIQGFQVPVKLNSEINGGAIQHWHTILDYHDVSANPINYIFHATGLAANVYYNARLKVDSWIGCFYGDTAFTTLPTGIIDEGKIAISLSAYPNPAKNYITVGLKNPLNSEAIVQIFSINGQKVSETKMTAGQLTSTISTANLAAGSYTVSFIMDGVPYISRIAVIK